MLLHFLRRRQFIVWRSMHHFSSTDPKSDDSFNYKRFEERMRWAQQRKKAKESGKDEEASSS